MRTLSYCCGFLPFCVSIGFLMSRLYNYILIDNHIYGRQLILGRSANLRGESTTGMENSELCHEQPILSSLLGHKREYVRLALQCICYPASLKVADIFAQKKLSFDKQRTWCSESTSAFWRILARNEQYLASVVVLVTLQFFLRFIRVNVTTLFFPMLSRTVSSKSSVSLVGNIVLVLVNSCGVLGSALATKQYGREVTFTIGAVLMIFCQVTKKWTLNAANFRLHLIYLATTDIVIKFMPARSQFQWCLKFRSVWAVELACPQVTPPQCLCWPAWCLAASAGHGVLSSGPFPAGRFTQLDRWWPWLWTSASVSPKCSSSWWCCAGWRM